MEFEDVDTPQCMVDMLNELLAEDPESVDKLINCRPYVTMAARELMGLDGHRLSFIGILNEVLRRHGIHDFRIGAEFKEIDNSEDVSVKFFHVMEIKDPIKEEEEE